MVAGLIDIVGTSEGARAAARVKPAPAPAGR
jgi:hypothetical protein